MNTSHHPKSTLFGLLVSGVSLTAMAAAVPACAQALQAAYSPAANNGGGAQAGRADIITIIGGTGTITGDYDLRGTSAARFEADRSTIGTRAGRGEVTEGYEAVAGRSVLPLGPEQKTQVVTYPDQIRGTRVTTLVYDNAALAEQASIDTRATTFVDTRSPVYGDLRVANISGAEVTIATGNKAASLYADANFAILTADSGSTLYNVGAGSRILYDARTATMDGADQDGFAQGPSAAVQVPVTTYAGTVFGDGDRVTDLASLRRYNSTLIAQLGTGAITPEQYERSIRTAAATTTSQVTVRTPEIATYDAPPTISERLFVKLDRSSLVTSATSELVGIVGADGNADGLSTLILAQNGSSVTNNGIIAQAEGGVGIRVRDAGSSLVNNAGGVIGIGYETLDRSSGRPVPTGLTDFQGYATANIAIRATDGATVSNLGIVNVSNRDISNHPEDRSYGKANSGIAVSSGATASNAGAILIGGAASAAADTRGLFDGAAGLVAFGGGTATNEATGVIRVGTSFAATTSELGEVRDVLSINPAAGMTSLSGGGTIVNRGTIRIGSLAQNATGMLVGGNGNVAINEGAITLDATGFTTPVERNVGILVRGSGVAGAIGATNSATGTITVGGVNSAGILVDNQVAGGSARAVNAGTIAVDGGLSADRLRNYGLFVSGAASSAVQAGAIVLRGEGAIGAHARSGGTIETSGQGSIDFQAANQIGYYSLGVGSRIVVASATAVDTAGSTGIRVEDGATLSGAGAVLSVTGSGAFGIVASGPSAGTTLDTSGSRIEVRGQGAAGVLVEGGATGVLAGTGTILLAGPGTIAAIVDGQKRALDGTLVGTPIAGTSLSSDAALTSAFDGLTGYVARNGGRLTHNGSVVFGGAGTTAILATTGGSVSDIGTIAIGAGGTGVRLVSAGAADVVTARIAGSVTANGGTLAARTRGVQASGAGATATLAAPSALILGGDGTIGAEAAAGGRIVVEEATVRFGGADQIGYRVTGAGSTLAGAALRADASATRATVLRVDEGAAAATGADAVLTASGAGALGVLVAGTGSSYAGSGRYAVTGDGAAALAVQGGANATLDGGARIDIAGRGTGARVDGRRLAIDGSLGVPEIATLRSDAVLNGTGDGGRGYDVSNGGTLVHGGTATLAGDNPIGIAVAGAGSSASNTGGVAITGSGTGASVSAGARLVNEGTIAVASGTGVLVDGAGSSLSGGGLVTAADGIAALRLVNGAAVTSANSFTGGGSAHAVLLDTGAGALTLGGGTLTTTGTGNGIENVAGAAIRLDGTRIVAEGSGTGVRTGVAPVGGSTATITAAGRDSTGFAFAGTGGATLAAPLTLDEGVRITASGEGATGVRLATTGEVTLGGTVTVTSAAGGAAVIGGRAAALVNTGTIASASNAAPAVDLRGGTRAFTNRGMIGANAAGARAILGGDGGQAVTLAAGAVTGDVVLGTGADTFVMSGGTLAGAFASGGGGDSATFRGLTDANLAGTTRIAGGGATGGSDAVTFDATSATGTRRITGWNRVSLVNGSTLTADGALTLANGTFEIDATSAFRAGGGANASVDADAGGRVTVTNAGTIDLTNGTSGAGDRLTIRGDYVGRGGTLKLETVLGDDASPTDRLVIDGGGVSGTTVIQVANVGGLGAATTGNGIEVVSGVNGGTTTATTTKDGFTLAGEHVDAGAYEYRLYASDPAGTSEGWFLRTQAPGAAPGTDAFRSEVPLLAGLPERLRDADRLMLSTYHQREGDEGGAVAPGFSVPGRIWGRFMASRIDARQRGDVHPEARGEMYGGQIGVDLFRYGAAGGHHNLGLYVGWMDVNARIRGYAGGIERSVAGRLEPDAKHLGAYWTYQADGGFYADTVIQVSWYGGRVRTADGTRIGIDGTGVLASVEVGYPLAIAGNWSLEPQGQLIGQGVSIDDATISGAQVTQSTPGYLTGRLGLRLKGRYAAGEGNVQPYLRANLWKGFAATDRATYLTPVSATTVATRTSSLWGEGGAGLTWSLASGLALYGEGDYRFTLDRDQGVRGHAVRGSIGLKKAL